jgi:hypothetical protein
MAIGPVERIVVDQHEPLLSRLMKSHTSGPVEMKSHAGKWLVDKMPARDYFTGKFIIEARQIISGQQTQADATLR